MDTTTEVVEYLSFVLREMNIMGAEKESKILIINFCQAQLPESSAVDGEAHVLTFLSRVILPKLTLLIYHFDSYGTDICGQNHELIQSKSSVKFSLNQLRTIYTTIELLWVCLIQKFVEVEVGNRVLQDLMYPKSFLLSKVVLDNIQRLVPIVNDSIVLESTVVMHSITKINLFRSLMLERNIGRILLSLLLLSRKESVSTSTEGGLHNAREQLQLLLQENDVSVKSLLMEECHSILNHTISSSTTTTRVPWLRTVISRFLSLLMTSSYGLESYLSCHLNTDDPSTLDTPTLLRIARVATSVPQSFQSSARSYIAVMAPQCVSLFHRLVTSSSSSSDIINKENKKMEEGNIVSRVLVMIIVRFCDLDPDATVEHLLLPLLEHLIQIGLPNHNHSHSHSHSLQSSITVSVDNDNDDTGVDVVSVKGRQLSIAVSVLRLLLTEGPRAPVLLACVRKTQAGRACLTIALEDNYRRDGIMSKIEVEAVCGLYLDGLTASDAVLDIIDVVLNAQCDYALGLLNNDATPPLSLSIDNIISSVSSVFPVNTLSEGLQQIFHRTNALCDIFCHLGWAITCNSSDGYDCGRSSEPQSEETGDGIGDTGLALPSHIFIHVLSVALGVKGLGLGMEEEEAEKEVRRSVGGGGVVLDKEQASVMALALQSKLSVRSLLKNGLAILQLLFACIQAHANRLIFFEKTSRTMNSVEVDVTSTNKLTYDEDCGSEMETDPEDYDENFRDLGTCLDMLGLVLGLGHTRREDAEEKVIRSLLDPLQVIGRLVDKWYQPCTSTPTTSLWYVGNDDDNDNTFTARGSGSGSSSLSKMVSDIALMIILRKTDNTNNNSHGAPSSNDTSAVSFEDSCSEAQSDLRDENPPMRALGVRKLSLLLKNNDSKNILPSNVELVWQLLMRALDDQDSFVYLGAVHAIALVLSRHRKVVLKHAMEAFEGIGIAAVVTTTTVYSVRQRALLGEALSLWLRVSGEQAPAFAPAVVRACLKVVRYRPHISKTKRKGDHEEDGQPAVDDSLVTWDVEDEGSPYASSPSESVVVDLLGYRVTRRSSEEDGERSTEMDVDKALLTADEVFLRQSAMSLLADAVLASSYAGIPLLRDVIDVVTGVVAMEASGHQEDVCAVRSATFVIRHIVCELGQKLLSMTDGPEHLSKIRRVLTVSVAVKSRRRNNNNDNDRTRPALLDTVALHHSVAALTALDELLYSAMDCSDHGVASLENNEIYKQFKDLML